MRSHLLCVSRVEESAVGRVVFTTNAKPIDWFQIESCLQDISTSSPPFIEPSAAPMNDPPQSASDGFRLVSLSAHQDIFQSAITAPDFAQGDHMALRHEVAFIEPTISGLN
jgi:hypothetical protein